MTDTDADAERAALVERLQDQVRALEGDAVQRFVLAQDLPTREAFVRARAGLRGLVEELRLAELADIARDLDGLGPEIRRGVADLAAEAERLAEARAVIDAVGRVAELVTRVVTLRLP